MMRKLLAFAFALLLSMSAAHAQIMVTPFIPDDVEGISDANRNLLTSKLGTILSENGMMTVENPVRFVLVMRWDVNGKQVLGTAPTTVSYDLNVTFIMGDGMLGTKYSSCSFSTKGVGHNEAQAIRNALKNINGKADDICSMVERGHKEIVRYYERNAKNIIAHAQGLLKQQDYEGAISTLYQIPAECSAYGQAQSLIGKAYQVKIDDESAATLAEAEAAWAADPSTENAQNVADMLGSINPASKSYSAARKLSATIRSRVQSINDDIRAEEKRASAHERNMEKAQVQAVRDIAVAYAKNQPAVTYKIVGWW